MVVQTLNHEALRGSVIQPSKNRTFASRGETDFRLLLYRFEGAEVRVEDLAVANHVSLRQNREPTLRVPRGLDVEFFTGFEIVGQLSEEFVSDETTFVVWKSILTSFVDLEGVVAPDDELSFFVYFPIQGPEAMCFAELADCLCIGYGRAGRRRRCLSVAIVSPRGTFLPRTPSGNKIDCEALLK